VKVFLANRSQNDYKKKNEDWEERAQNFDYDFRTKVSPGKVRGTQDVIEEEDEERKNVSTPTK
jgi:hypothetical protein